MECLAVVGFFVVFALFGRYIMAMISILLGDKESLHDTGNLCDEPMPWQDQIWTYDEKRKPGDPKYPPWKKPEDCQ